MTKNSVCRTRYLRNHTSCDCHLWYTCKMMTSSGIFFIFFQNFNFLGSLGGRRGVKKQKMAQNDKKSVCLTTYLRNRTSFDCDFWYTRVKWWYLHQNFSFFKILIFGAFGVKGQKWPKITYFSLFCYISWEL